MSAESPYFGIAYLGAQLLSPANFAGAEVPAEALLWLGQLSHEADCCEVEHRPPLTWL